MASSASAQTTLLDSSTAQPANGPGSYETSQALFADARKGVLVDLLRHNDRKTLQNLAKSVYFILQKEYGVPKDRMYVSERDPNFGSILAALTNAEFDADKTRYVKMAQQAEDQAFGNPRSPYRPTFEDSRASFRRFAGQYTQAVRDYAAQQQREKDQRLAAQTEQKRVAEANEQQVAEDRRKQKEYADARQASQKAEQDIKDTAMRNALVKAKQAREEKLAEVLASPAYKLWKVALQVQQGQELIAKAQRVLEHDDAVKQESGVTDLASRRAAGEQMVAGKELVETSFAAYKELGGKAVTPGEVVPGPDPAAEYR